MENPPFEDVFPIQDGDFPLLCLFTGVYLQQADIRFVCPTSNPTYQLTKVLMSHAEMRSTSSEAEPRSFKVTRTLRKFLPCFQAAILHVWRVKYIYPP